MSMAFSLCSRVGCRVIKVDAKNNPKTINFYKKHGGFVQAGTGDETVPMIIDMNKIHCHDIDKNLTDFDDDFNKITGENSYLDHEENKSP